MATILYRVKGPRFVAGFLCKSSIDQVISAAPILHKLKHHSIKTALQICEENRWTVEKLGEHAEKGEV